MTRHLEQQALHPNPHPHNPDSPLRPLDVACLRLVRDQALEQQALSSTVRLTEGHEVQLHVGVVALEGVNVGWEEQGTFASFEELVGCMRVDMRGC